MLSHVMMFIVASFLVLAQPVAKAKNITLSVEQTTCMTEAIYFESRGEGLEGENAVAYVILNRTKLDHESICEVIHSRDQFSFYHPGQHLYVRDESAWRQAVKVAIDTQLHEAYNPIGNATFYNTTPFYGKVKHIRLVRKVNHQYFYAYDWLIYKPAIVHRQEVTFRRTHYYRRYYYKSSYTRKVRYRRLDHDYHDIILARKERERKLSRFARV